MANTQRANGPQDVKALRAASFQAGEKPGGAGRTSAFPAELRANVVVRNGKQFLHVDGYATIFNRGYTMWDMFGEYTEIAESGMLDKSLAKKPDVAFLTNHKGITMARTTNGSLTLAADQTGLGIDGFLNLDRQDVRDLASAITDELVDEMSFAFMIEDGEWNEDFSEFRIKQVDINRGDVSAVNYGANPYTSIAARAQEFMRTLTDMPASVRAEALKRIMVSEDAPDVVRATYTLSERAGTRFIDAGRRAATAQGIDFSDWEVVDETGEEDPTDGPESHADESAGRSGTEATPNPIDRPHGRSTAEVDVRLSDTEDDENSAGQTRSADDGKTTTVVNSANLVRNRLAAMLDDEDEDD